MFESFYASHAQHPGLLLASAVLGYVIAQRAFSGRHASVRRAAAALFLLACVDAWFSADEVIGIGRLPGSAPTWVTLAFVLLGDLRYLLAAESLRGDGRVEITTRGLLRALGWMLVVPIASELVVSFALVSAEPRVLFLVYELLFIALIVLRRPYVEARLGSPEAIRWHRALDRLALAWYASWSLADALILGLPGEASDVGFLVRLLPNALYYGAMPAVLARAAPRSAE